MSQKSTDRQFQEADAAIERAVAVFARGIDRMMWRWSAVAPTYVITGVLEKLCEELPRLIIRRDLPSAQRRREGKGATSAGPQ